MGIFKFKDWAVALSFAVSLAPFTSAIAQSNSIASLQTALQIAICQNDWLAAVSATDSLLASSGISSEYRAELTASRRQFVSRHNSRAIINMGNSAECADALSTNSVPTAETPNFDWDRGLAAVGSSSGSRSVSSENVSYSGWQYIAEIQGGEILQGDPSSLRAVNRRGVSMYRVSTRTINSAGRTVDRTRYEVNCQDPDLMFVDGGARSRLYLEPGTVGEALWTWSCSQVQ